MNSEFGILYLIPCPISDETAPWDVLPAANRAVMDALDYFIVENTRTARRFLSKAGIARPIGELEFRELNEHTAAGREIEELIAPLLEGELLTTDLKAVGHGVYLFAGKTPEQQAAAWERFTALARAGKVVSAWAVENGLAEAVMKMSFGNEIGFAAENTVLDWFAPIPGAIVAELSNEVSDAVRIGITTAEKAIALGADLSLIHI